MMRIKPTKLIVLERKMSAGDSSSRGGGKSKGLIWCSDVREILKYRPSTASAKNSYSRSGSITITSTPNIKLLNISSLVA